MSRKIRAFVGVVLAAVGLVVSVAVTAPSAGATDYEDPFFLNWPTFVASAPSTYEDLDVDDCHSGRINCVDKVIRNMTSRYNALACDHDSAFAFTYLLTTEEYREAASVPGFFVDPEFLNRQDEVFAEYYFEAFDDWHAARIAEVPPAWRVAFQTAQDQKVTGMGNVFLGMNAHINRDLPFVFEELGMVMPDGTSRKVDHDKVNQFLAATNQYLLAEAAKVLDPTLDDGDVPGTSIDNSTAVQLVVSWREQAWRNAERLVSASTPEDRARVAAEIEEFAAMEALTIRQSFSYNLTHTLQGTDRTARNSFCESHFVAR